MKGLDVFLFSRCLVVVYIELSVAAVMMFLLPVSSVLYCTRFRVRLDRDRERDETDIT